MITPLSFAIHVTYTCPLSCAHCCFSSSPANNDRLALDHILATIRALDPSTIRMVAFTGGEPFLLGHKLIEAVKVASQRGFTVRVVTSAYFAKDSRETDKKLQDLVNAGLNELSISWDDFHEEFVDFACIRNCFWAGKKVGLRTAINVVQAEHSRWSAERIRKELGVSCDSGDVIVESPLNLTGRAVSELNDAGLRAERSLGPCPYVLTGPTLSAKNKLLACCGVIPDTQELTLDHNFMPINLSDAIAKGLRSPLLNWIHLRGPYSVMKWISNRFGITIPKEAAIGGNCEACRILFETKAIAEKLSEAIEEKTPEIEGELALLESLGFLNPDSVLRLWMDGSTCVDTAQLHPPVSIDAKATQNVI